MALSLSTPQRPPTIPIYFQPTEMSSLSTDSFNLHTYYRSSCSARLRIALNLKSIKPTYTYINLVAPIDHSASHLNPAYHAINPSRSVPTLTVTSPGEKAPITITQSISALEFLDEAYPNTYQLLPPVSDPVARATVRTLVEIIASDTQPVTNLRILKRVRALAGEDAGAQWARELLQEGLAAYEVICAKTAGRFSVGDRVTMADCCLIPAVWGAERYGVDMEQLPTVKRVAANLAGLEEVKRAHWQRQEDTPESLRGNDA